MKNRTQNRSPSKMSDLVKSGVSFDSREISRCEDLSAVAQWTREEIYFQAYKLALFFMPIKAVAAQIALEAIRA